MVSTDQPSRLGGVSVGTDGVEILTLTLEVWDRGRRLTDPVGGSQRRVETGTWGQFRNPVTESPVRQSTETGRHIGSPNRFRCVDLSPLFVGLEAAV